MENKNTGCVYCKDDVKHISKMLGLFKTTESGEYYTYDVYVYEGILRIGCDRNCIVKFDYCPKCGKKL